MALPREVSEPLTGGLGFPSPLAVPVTGRWPGGIQKPRAGLVVHIHIVPHGRVWSSFTWAWGADGEEGVCLRRWGRWRFPLGIQKSAYKGGSHSCCVFKAVSAVAQNNQLRVILPWRRLIVSDAFVSCGLIVGWHVLVTDSPQIPFVQKMLCSLNVREFFCYSFSWEDE